MVKGLFDKYGAFIAFRDFGAKREAINSVDHCDDVTIEDMGYHCRHFKPDFILDAAKYVFNSLTAEEDENFEETLQQLGWQEDIGRKLVKRIQLLKDENPELTVDEVVSLFRRSGEVVEGFESYKKYYFINEHDSPSANECLSALSSLIEDNGLEMYKHPKTQYYADFISQQSKVLK